MSSIKTASDLKFYIEQSGHEPHYFSRESMRFFGDTMKNYGVRKTSVSDMRGNSRSVWELYRRSAVKHGNTSSAYFDTVTFERVFTPI